MRKYLKPAMEMEAFDVEDVITVSGGTPHDEVGDGAFTPANLDIDFN